MRARISALAAGLVLLAGPALAQRSGTYAVEGTTAQGSRYEGSAQLTATGPSTWRITWRTQGETASGVGLVVDGRLVIGYVGGRETGAAVYTIEPDGTLVGRWTQGRDGGVGTERLLPR